MLQGAEVRQGARGARQWTSYTSFKLIRPNRSILSTGFLGPSFAKRIEFLSLPPPNFINFPSFIGSNPWCLYRRRCWWVHLLGFWNPWKFWLGVVRNSAEFLFDLAWRHHHRSLHETSSQTTSSRAKIEEEASMKKRSRPSGESDTLDLRFACLALMKSSSKAQHSPPQLRNCSNFLHRDHHRSMSGAAVAEYRSLAWPLHLGL